MVPIMIDISPLVNKLRFSEEEVKGLSKAILDRISSRYMYLWEKNVDDNLKSTRAFYKAGMKWYYEDDFNVVFELEGKGVSKLGLMLERGVDAYDLKEGFKKSSNAKNQGQPNWYLTVQFRMATSDAIAESSVFAGVMPKLIYNLAKKEGSVTKSNIPDEFNKLNVRQEIKGSSMVDNKTAAYTHKNPIHEGITKTSGGYVSFRRVSGNSDQNSWIHKGFQKRGFMGASLEQLSGEIAGIVDLAEKEFLNLKFS